MTIDPCEQCEELLQGYLDRELSDAEVTLAESHLDGCDYCRRRYRFEEHLRRYVRTTAAERIPPACSRSWSSCAPKASPLGVRPVLRVVDVARRAEVVARDEHDELRTEPSSGTSPPLLSRARAGALCAATRRTRRRPGCLASATPRARGRPPREPDAAPSASTTTAAGRRRSSAASPHRSEAPGPFAHSLHVTTRHGGPCNTVLQGSWSAYAPSTTTISSSSASCRRARTRGSKRTCFGEPNRDASPAARTTAATRIPRGAPRSAAEPRSEGACHRSRFRMLRARRGSVPRCTVPLLAPPSRGHPRGG